MKKIFLVVIIILIMIVVVRGFANNSEVVLNERQIEILEEMGLSTDYNSLGSQQKKAIVAIEEMLQAMEEKYDEEFAYAGYVAAGILEDETLYAYSVANGSPDETFTVTREKSGLKYVYEDTYMKILVKDMVEEYVSEIIKDEVSDYSAKVYLKEINKVYLDTAPKDFSELESNVGANYRVFVDSSELSQTDFSEFVSEIQDIMYAHQMYGSFYIYLMKDNYFQVLTEENYKEYLSDEFYSIKETIYIYR